MNKDNILFKNIKFYDSLNNKYISLSDILNKNNLRIYICGPTLNKRNHIGNLRPHVSLDFIIRIIKYYNVDLKYEIYGSITDIGIESEDGNDKIINEQNLAQINTKLKYSFFISQYYQKFIEDLNYFKLVKCNYIRASCLFEEYQNNINNIDKNNIYHNQNLGLYVNPLFIQKNKDLLIYKGSRLESFAVWRSHNQGFYNLKYENKIYKGIPGWHIECFSIIKKYFFHHNQSNNCLVDIHVGGCDLLDIISNCIRFYILFLFNKFKHMF